MVRDGVLSYSELLKQVNWYEDRYGPYIERRGLHNWKNLLRKPNLLEWTILAMLVLGLFMAYAYGVDTKQCRETLSNIKETACMLCGDQIKANMSQSERQYPSLDINLSEFIVKEAN